MSTTSKTQDLLGALARVRQEAPLAEIAGLLGELEALKAVLWQRLLAAAVTSATPQRDAIDDLRHLTPAQVAELLNLQGGVRPRAFPDGPAARGEPRQVLVDPPGRAPRPTGVSTR
jgi:hypothetical protein